MRHDVRTIIIIIIQRKCSVDMTSVGLTQAHPNYVFIVLYNRALIAELAMGCYIMRVVPMEYMYLRTS